LITPTETDKCQEGEESVKRIKTWSERCEEHPDHQERIITERMIQERMQEEIDELRQALEEKQEPVAWITNGGKGELWWYQSSKFDEEGNLIGLNQDDIPLYTAPPQREWVGLTLNEAEDFYEKYTDRAELINAVDRFLEEKNT
jgi:hypothetical protein